MFSKKRLVGLSEEKTMTEQQPKRTASEKNCDNNNHEITIPDGATKQINNKKFYGIPYPVIYLMILRVSCPFCNKRGRAKVFKNLWQLRMHFTSQHLDDQFTQGCKNTIGELVDYMRLQQSLTERGVLR